MKILKGIFKAFNFIWIVLASGWTVFSIKEFTTNPELIEHRKKCVSEIKEAWKNRNN